MKWINGETRDSKIERKQEWHTWFAWYPVIVGYVKIGNKTRRVKVWLGYVERISRPYFDANEQTHLEFIYREIKK